jgi:hypothetical protein
MRRIPLSAWREVVRECRRHQDFSGAHPCKLRLLEARDTREEYRAIPADAPERGCLMTLDVQYDARGYACLFGWYGGARVTLWQS